MNAETENRTEVDTSVGSEFEPPTEVENGLGTEAEASAGIEVDESRIIEDAIARGSTVTRWISMVTGLLLIASGLWWAGILVVVVTTFDLPRLATQQYARKRGVELSVPSAQTVEKTSLTGLLVAAVFLPAVCGLIVAEMALGHPLLPWSWRTPLTEDPDPFIVLPLAIVALVIIISWFVRRQKASRRKNAAQNSQEGPE